jgi:hypothetical protein
MGILSFRALYWKILQYEGPQLFADVLQPWQPHAERGIEALRPYGTAEAIGWRKNLAGRTAYADPRQLQLWELYALSRVSDLLLLPFQAMRHAEQHRWDPWAGPAITSEERNAWFRSLGMRPVEQPTFHPFYHEVVAVEQAADPAEPIRLMETVWPGFLLDRLIVCRAGVRVRGGVEHIRKVVAEESTLYWTYRRNDRPTDDLSHGWGSSSQWWTDFRRDYEDRTALWYNVDGDEPEGLESVNSEAAGSLTPSQRRELVVNRCLIVTPAPPPEQAPYPYHWPYREDR